MTNYFAKNIKYLRNKKNIGQKIMAENLGIAQSTLSCWESGRRTPNMDMIVKISQYLDIYDDLISKDLTIENNTNYSELDHLLFSKFKKLNDEEKKIILEIINIIHKS